LLSLPCCEQHNVKTFGRISETKGAVGEIGCVLVCGGAYIKGDTTLYPNIHNILYVTLGN